MRDIFALLNDFMGHGPEALTIEELEYIKTLVEKEIAFRKQEVSTKEIPRETR